MHLRRSKSFECHQEQHKPEDGVNCLDREFLCGEQQRKQGYVTRNSKRPKSSQVASILECEQTERDDDKQDRLFMDVPAKQEGSIATQCDCSHKVVPARLQKDLDQGWLRQLARDMVEKLLKQRTICATRVRTNVTRDEISGRTANDVSPTRPRVTLFTAAWSIGSLR